MDEVIPMAIRSVQADERFIDNVVEQFGFSRDDGWKILNTYIKCKFVKLDWAGGVYHIKHGALWDKYIMERAVEEA